MKGIKRPEIIAIDLDGTLLNSNYEISDENLKRLREVDSLGIKIIPATGRRFSSAINFLEKIPCNTFAILQNGALILNKDSREIFFSAVMEREIFDAIFEFNIINSFYPVYISSPFYGNKLFLSERLEKYKRLEMYLEKQRGGIEIFKRDGLRKIEISQIMYFGEVEKMKKVYKMIKNKFGNSVSITVTEYLKRDLSIVDVMRKGISKGSGLKMIADYLGVKREKIWAIGDNINDIEMFRVASFSMAMSNGCDKVKKSASIIIPENDKNGVSEGLKILVGG